MGESSEVRVRPFNCDDAQRMRDITDKLQGITRYETMDYAENSKILNIHQSSE